MTYKIYFIIILYILCFSNFSCNKKNESKCLTNDCIVEKEKIELKSNILNYILPEIVDSILTSPKNKNPKNIDFDYLSEEDKEYYRILKEVRLKREKDTTRTVIILDPYFDFLEVNCKCNKINFPIKLKISDSLKQKSYLKYDFSKVKLNGKYRFENLEKYDLENVFYEEHEFYFDGVLFLYDLKVFEGNKLGKLYVYYTRGRLAGVLYDVEIEYIKNKWKIKTFKLTMVS